MFKKNFLLLAALVLFFSCSKDNADVIQTPTTNATTIDVVSSTQVIYKTDGSVEETIKYTYENNRPATSTYFNTDNVITYTETITYNDFGNIKSIKGQLPDNTVNSFSSYTYDSQNRISTLESSQENGTYKSVTDFTYNSDNSITRKKSTNSNVVTFFLNEKGMVYKQIENISIGGSKTFEAKFDSENNLTKVTEWSIDASGVKSPENTKTYALNPYKISLKDKNSNAFIIASNEILTSTYFLDKIEGYNFADIADVIKTSLNGKLDEIRKNDLYTIEFKNASNGILKSKHTYIYQAK